MEMKVTLKCGAKIEVSAPPGDKAVIVHLSNLGPALRIPGVGWQSEAILVVRRENFPQIARLLKKFSPKGKR